MFKSFDPKIWTRVVPFLIYILFIVLADVLAKYDGLIDIRWLYVIKVTAVGLVLWYLRRHYIELYQVSKPNLQRVGVSVVAGTLVFILWINLEAPWMQIGQPSLGFNPTDANEVNWLLVLTRIAGAALIVPLMEELFWRSFLMRWIANVDFVKVDPKSVGLIALLLSSALFAVEHNLWLAGFVAGVVYGLLYIRSGNIWMPIIGHAVTNAMLGFWVIYTNNWGFW